MLKRFILAAMAAASLAAAAQAQPAKVNIGYATASDYLAVFVAKEKGYFDKHNIDAVITRVPIITNVPPALVSGSMQIGVTTMPSLLQAVDGGLDLTLIAGAARHIKERPTISLAVKKDFKYEKPADLVGKKVGVSGLNNVMDVFMRKWLMNNGVDPKRVTFIEVPLPQMPDMLRNGTLDAATPVEPIRSAVVNSGAGTIVAEFFSDVNPNVLVSGWITTGDWARKNPQVVKNFREAIDEGLAYIKTNPEDLKDIEKKYLGFNAPRWPEFSNAATPEDLKPYIDIGAELGIYRTKFDASKFVQK
ncbi:MAG: hypothetical protein JWO64_1330 [Hyphomicrobiales bacterium]|jgi:NitT/TauT family transport system substrate-binding protein|nr:hypothetical protein [Hyphomicrobiales bacterium]